MNTWPRDGFVTMVSASAATVFYGAPLILAALWSPSGLPVEPMDPDPGQAIESGSVRMLLPASIPDEPEVEAPEEPEVQPERPSRPVRRKTEAPPGGEGADGAEGTAGGEEIASGDAPGPSGRPKGKSKRQKNCEVPHPNIHPGEDLVEIDRSLVEEYTRNLESFMSLGYSRPYDEKGIRGWYIGGFGCTSPVHKAGFRRGDVLLSVNGKNTRSWVGVYLLYQKLKHREDFAIELVRKGRRLTLKFRIVPG